jgi:ABC-type microcin C transport system permease subunit YejE
MDEESIGELVTFIPEVPLLILGLPDGCVGDACVTGASETNPTRPVVTSVVLLTGASTGLLAESSIGAADGFSIDIGFFVGLDGDFTGVSVGAIVGIRAGVLVVSTGALVGALLGALVGALTGDFVGAVTGAFVGA